MAMGFDPLFHFMHESDIASALALAIEKPLRGVYNVAGPPPLPLSDIIRHTDRVAVPLPDALLRLARGRLGLPRLPSGAIQHLQYPIVVDGTAFAKAVGFVHQRSEIETLEEFRTQPPLFSQKRPSELA